MRHHVEALFTHDAAGDLIHVNEPGGAPAPRFFAGRTEEGMLVRFRHDVAHDVRRELEAALAHDAILDTAFDAPIDPWRYEEVLARSAPVTRTWTGPAFCFPGALRATGEAIAVDQSNAQLLAPLLSEWLPDVETHWPMYVLPVDGKAASVCCSVRRTAMAHEAGVETAPACRGRGYAASVVTAWASAVRAMGGVPLYSTSWHNEASRALARKLGLICFGGDVHIT
jgi:hypothetical protein